MSVMWLNVCYVVKCRLCGQMSVIWPNVGNMVLNVCNMVLNVGNMDVKWLTVCYVVEYGLLCG